MGRYDDYKKAEEARTLTAAEQRRTEVVEKVAADLEGQGYARHDLTVGLVFANVMAIVLALPFFVLFGALFVATWHGIDLHVGLSRFLIVLSVLVALIFVHEGIHGLTWGALATQHFKSIEFGFIKEYATPYCTCTEPLRRWQYVLGGLMPCIVLGVIPSIAAVATGSIELLVVGLLMILGAGGDLTIVGKLLLHRTEARDVLYMDHPTQGGCIAFER